jgi:hypothetical protein
MKRHASYALAGVLATMLAASTDAQPTPQTPAPAAQPAPSTPATEPTQDKDQSSKPTVPKDKPCEPVVIRAGPNQGQVINKCRHKVTPSAGSQTSGQR